MRSRLVPSVPVVLKVLAVWIILGRIYATENRLVVLSSPLLFLPAIFIQNLGFLVFPFKAFR